MLEKIGLPAKPSARGASWVLDASHCQGCSSPFSVFNRKHHCRRCGGIFCGNCTNQRLVLRGQGDNPVRICEPCKKLEESARFEARPWNKNKIVKGGSKSANAVDTDALLKQLIGEGSPSNFEADELSVEELLEQHGATDAASTSGRTDGITKKSKQGDSKATSVGSATNEVVSPEKLHQLAQEEKKKYTQLKKDGRSEDALKAFKRSKELDRQADALELSLRKSKRKAIQTGDLVQAKEDKSGVLSEDLPPHGGKSSALKGRRASSMNAVDQNDDVLSALKELGWNDAELHEKPQKRAGIHSIDGDLAAILESIEDPPKDSSATKVRHTSLAPETSAGGPAQMRILGHKRKALALKKEGKMAEAKEELKKAKILERQLEEAALLGEEDEEDDELAVIMRSLEREVTLGDRSNSVDASVDLSNLTVLGEHDDDTRVDVSDADLNDPAMVEALRAMGWTEEAHALQKSTEPDSPLQHLQSVISKEKELQKQILASKRKALVLRREGKGEEAQLEFKCSEVLEQELQELKNRSGSGAHHPSAVTPSVHGYGPETNAVPGLNAILHDDEVDADVTEDDMHDPELMSALRALGFAEEPPVVKHVVAAAHPHPQDTAALQQEILAIKRSALALKREGKTAEAKDQLMRSRALEQKLQMQQEKSNVVDEVPGTRARNEALTISGKVPTERQPLQQIAPDISSEDEVGGDSEAEVEESDYVDPDIAAALQAMGWQEDSSPQKVEKNETKPIPAIVQTRPVTSLDPRKTQRQEQKSRSELQKELLGLKRCALGLRREGKAEEADEVLRQARILENELDEVQAYEPPGRSKPPPKGFSEQSAHKPSFFAENDENDQVTDDDMLDPQLLTALQDMGWKDEAPRPFPDADSVESLVPAQSSKGLAPLKTEHQAANNPAPAGTSRQTTSWNGQAGKDGNVSGPGGPSKPVTGADVAQEVRSTWDEQDPFRGEFGEIGETVDIAPPLFDHPLKNVGNFIKSVMAPSAASPVKGTGFDLLTGDMWTPPPDAKSNVHSPVKNIGGPNEEQDVDGLDPGLMVALAGLGISDSKKEKARPSVVSTARLQDKVSAAGRQGDPVGRKVTPGNNEEEVNQNTQCKSHAGTAASDAGFSAARLQQGILAHKRMALALKREGKRLEATDALRQAKLLEQQLARLQTGQDDEQNSGDQGEHLSASASSAQALRVTEPAAPPVKSGGVSKEQRQQQVRQGKDRMKLQQESLAHKRKALGLRREGKTVEAEAEFELAKSLEEQMKDLEPEKVADTEDVGNVDDIFDPQLMAALKGLGLTDGGSKPAAPSKNLVAQPTNVRPAGTSGGGAGSLESAGHVQRPSSTRSKDLEDRIKAEKVKAVQLKRAGKPTEAMNALREAKKLEKQLLSITAR